MEVYNEVLRDLGSRDGREGMLDLREDPVTGARPVLAKRNLLLEIDGRKQGQPLRIWWTNEIVVM